MTGTGTPARFSLATLAVPVVGAPMAGGPTTPALAAAVIAGGGLGFLAGGYLTAAQLAGQIAALQDLTDRPFGVNLFVPETQHEDEAMRAAVATYRSSLHADAQRLGVTVPEPIWRDDDDWDAKIALLTQVCRVSVVSFTFGLPSQEVVDAFHAAGTAVWATATCVDEARAAMALDVDAVVVQGFEAGGHRATHSMVDTPEDLDHLALLSLLRGAPLPLIAAGGITTPDDVRRALRAGASAVQVGTALLRSPEAGTTHLHRMALADPSRHGVVTRAYTGRPARGLANRFSDDHDTLAPAAYPLVHHLTKPLRAAAAAAGDLEGVSLWAGAGWRAATEEPAAEIVRRLGGGAA